MVDDVARIYKNYGTRDLEDTCSYGNDGADLDYEERFHRLQQGWPRKGHAGEVALAPAKRGRVALPKPMAVREAIKMQLEDCRAVVPEGLSHLRPGERSSTRGRPFSRL